jgi:hypothetical protein
MALDHPAESLKQALEEARRKLRLLDPTWAAFRSGASYSFPSRSFVVNFFGRPYRVTFPEGGVIREDGATAGAREAIILLHYLVHADGSPVEERWIAYRDLPGARYHEPAFAAEAEAPLSTRLAGRLEDLRKWVEGNAQRREISGDLAFVWYVLPRVPLLIIFNERDEEFPASARILFDASAPGYLPTEDLSVLAEIASWRILEECGAL